MSKILKFILVPLLIISLILPVYTHAQILIPLIALNGEGWNSSGLDSFGQTFTVPEGEQWELTSILIYTRRYGTCVGNGVSLDIYSITGPAADSDGSVTGSELLWSSGTYNLMDWATSPDWHSFFFDPYLILDEGQYMWFLHDTDNADDHLFRYYDLSNPYDGGGSVGETLPGTTDASVDLAFYLYGHYQLEPSAVTTNPRYDYDTGEIEIGGYLSGLGGFPYGDCKIAYGLDTSYGVTIDCLRQSIVGYPQSYFSTTLSGIPDATTFHYRAGVQVFSADGLTSWYYWGEDQTFEMLSDNRTNDTIVLSLEENNRDGQSWIIAVDCLNGSYESGTGDLELSYGDSWNLMSGYTQTIVVEYSVDSIGVWNLDTEILDGEVNYARAIIRHGGGFIESNYIQFKSFDVDKTDTQNNAEDWWTRLGLDLSWLPWLICLLIVLIFAIITVISRKPYIFIIGLVLGFIIMFVFYPELTWIIVLAALLIAIGSIIIFFLLRRN